MGCFEWSAVARRIDIRGSVFSGCRWWPRETLSKSPPSTNLARVARRFRVSRCHQLKSLRRLRQRGSSHRPARAGWQNGIKTASDLIPASPASCETIDVGCGGDRPARSWCDSRFSCPNSSGMMGTSKGAATFAATELASGGNRWGEEGSAPPSSSVATYRRRSTYPLFPAKCRGVAQPGSAPALGAGGPGSESRRPDHFPNKITRFRAISRLFLRGLSGQRPAAFSSAARFCPRFPGQDGPKSGTPPGADGPKSGTPRHSARSVGRVPTRRHRSSPSSSARRRSLTCRSGQDGVGRISLAAIPLGFCHSPASSLRGTSARTN